MEARAADPKPAGRMASITAALMSITHRGQSAAHPNPQHPKTPRTPRTPHTPGGGGSRSAPWRTNTTVSAEAHAHGVFYGAHARACSLVAGRQSCNTG